ncbi:MAG: hypothetical protein LAP38_00995 [Acidobacteriia bacterium]|nr:hypothetical protein [Terriglobia bacterium]
MKKQPKRSVLVLARSITAVVSLLGAEGMLYLLGYPSWRGQQLSVSSDQYETDPELGWKSHAGIFDLTGPLRKESFRYTNWSQGRRATSAREPDQSAGGRPEVAFFGDSYVQGYGLTDSETFPWIFQARHPELKVDNYGTSYYGTYQSYLALKKSGGRAAQVFYLLNGFHEERNVVAVSWVRVTKAPPPGFFFPYAELSRGSLGERRSEGELVWPISRLSRTAAMLEDYYELARAYGRVHNKQRVTEMLLAKMDETARARGGEFTVILFDMTPEQRKSYRQYLESHQIALIDCGHAELNDRSLRLPDGHPNPKLNELLAGWIEPKQVTVR